MWVAWVADNYVVENFDLEQLTGPYQITGNFDVPFTGRTIQGWMVVHQNAGCPRCDDDRPKHFQGPHEAGVQVSQRNQVVPDDPAPGIENQDYQRLLALVIPVGLGDVLLPVFGSTFRGVDELSREGAFPDPHDFEFMGRSLGGGFELIVFHKDEASRTLLKASGSQLLVVVVIWLPFVDHARLPIDRADCKAFCFNAIGIVINNGNVDVGWEVDDFMDYPAFHDDEDF